MSSRWPKLTRARELLHTIHAGILEYHDSDPYSFRDEHLDKPPRLVLDVESVRDPPVHLGVLVGEFVHNLRSTLMLTAGASRDARGDLPADAIAAFVRAVVGRDDRLEQRLIEIATLGSETLLSTVNAHRALLRDLPGEEATIAGNPDLDLVDLFDELHQHLRRVPAHVGERDANGLTFDLESYERKLDALNSRLEHEGIVGRPVDFGGNFYQW
jgi:hypothetical protein